ncbi:hypothetical protein FC83_GL000598 [Agrilactobacillus composti DSM 18527 = JCM 14202]|uniref:Uncharacterized protein n=1 Tax=Agrilactobacillus composti DSM 18527 = JCM 14202 TaxID=1423734 RepID=X0QLH0_9LACO|nr:hypothetical protein [Agrilactobacillus composti]KRM31537.1 hypothetical protein FC83_GL000598 [Agrilactobacillus composti DSM 18527 = JCM 14202]GAF39445.1 hypothetical protein JCM14202_1308 [Agrilactobacillus composti DSM 18527 = JCM 14202]
MSENYLYVHLETVTNMILSYGISMGDFVNSFKHVPEHLMLLSPVDPDEMIDPHTGFNVISGRENVLGYLLNPKIHGKKWIDYKHTLYLDEVTPLEVSELLYLGHAYTHLSSPFYYKLANRYVYLQVPNGNVKTYYRHLDDFYRVLSNAIVRCFEQHHFEQNFLFRRNTTNFVPLDQGTIQTLHQLLIDGVLFNFMAAKRDGGFFQVPLYQLRHRFSGGEAAWLADDDILLGHLRYNRETQHWNVTLQA